MSKTDNYSVESLLSSLAEAYGIKSWQDSIYEFINSELNDKPSSKEARYAVAMLLMNMIEEGRRGRSWDKFKKPLGVRKWSGVLNPYSNRDQYNQAHAIVYDYVAYHLTEDEAIKSIKRIAPHIQRRRIQDFIAEHRDKIASKLEIGDRLNFKKIERIRK